MVSGLDFGDGDEFTLRRSTTNWQTGSKPNKQPFQKYLTELIRKHNYFLVATNGLF